MQMACRWWPWTEEWELLVEVRIIRWFLTVLCKHLRVSGFLYFEVLGSPLGVRMLSSWTIRQPLARWPWPREKWTALLLMITVVHLWLWTALFRVSGGLLVTVIRGVASNDLFMMNVVSM